MSALATLRHTNGDLDPTTYGLIPNKKETWDFNRMYGCYCDATWAGYDCSKRTCSCWLRLHFRGQRVSTVCMRCLPVFARDGVPVLPPSSTLPLRLVSVRR